jgi:hypothetical protein
LGFQKDSKKIRVCRKGGGGLKNKNTKIERIHEVFSSQDDDNDEQKCIRAGLGFVK